MISEKNTLMPLERLKLRRQQRKEASEFLVTKEDPQGAFVDPSASLDGFRQHVQQIVGPRLRPLTSPPINDMSDLDLDEDKSNHMIPYMPANTPSNTNSTSATAGSSLTFFTSQDDSPAIIFFGSAGVSLLRSRRVALDLEEMSECPDRELALSSSMDEY